MKCETFALDRDQFRENLLSFTRKAYRLLPPLNQPRILDVGCGSGVVTMELARLSGGDVVAIDIDQKALNKLTHKSAAGNLSDRIMVLCGSMNDMVFPPEDFDIIWTEGAISFIGLESAMKDWRKFLAPGGYLVLHDRVSVLKSNTELAPKYGYKILSQFDVPQKAWWDNYYLPLKNLLEKLCASGHDKASLMEDIGTVENEIARFDETSDMYGSMFLLLQKL